MIKNFPGSHYWAHRELGFDPDLTLRIKENVHITSSTLWPGTNVSSGHSHNCCWAVVGMELMVRLLLHFTYAQNEAQGAKITNTFILMVSGESGITVPSL